MTERDGAPDSEHGETPPLPAAARKVRAQKPTRPVPVAQRPAPAAEPARTEPAQEPAGRRPRRLATSAAAHAPPAAQTVAPPDAERAPPAARAVRGRRSALPEEDAQAPRRPRASAPPASPREPHRPVSQERPPQPAPQRPAPPFQGEELPELPERPEPREERLARRRARPPALPAAQDAQIGRFVDAPATDAVVEDGPIVSPDTVSGRSLTTMVAIMTFLCAVLFGSAIIIDRAADAWSAQVLDDISVTVLPLDGDPIERRVTAVVTMLQAEPGLTQVEALSASQARALLEPWLGSGADLSLLPVPRLVSARRGDGFDAADLARTLEAIPGVLLDDHGEWSERLSRMAATVTGAAVAGLLLMLAATAISIVFATRSTIATNAATVEVLHALGAEERFVQRAFGRRFVRIGLRGAAFGLLGAVLLFGVLEGWAMLSAGATSQQSVALLGAPRIGPSGFAALLGVALGVAALVVLTTRLAVRHHLRDLSR